MCDLYEDLLYFKSARHFLVKCRGDVRAIVTASIYGSYFVTNAPQTFEARVGECHWSSLGAGSCHRHLTWWWGQNDKCNFGSFQLEFHPVQVSQSNVVRDLTLGIVGARHDYNQTRNLLDRMRQSIKNVGCCISSNAKIGDGAEFEQLTPIDKRDVRMLIITIKRAPTFEAKPTILTVQIPTYRSRPCHRGFISAARP